MKNHSIALSSLVLLLIVGYFVSAASGSTTPTLKFSEGKKALLFQNSLHNYSRARGVGANCHYDDSQNTIKKFICEFSFSKKILNKKIEGKAEMSLAVNLQQYNVKAVISANDDILYEDTYTMGDLIPPLCADVFFEVGLCLKLRDISFHSSSPQCFKMNLEAYLQALTFHETILSEPIGYNANLC